MAVEKKQFQNGPCNIDCILTKENKMYILEVSQEWEQLVFRIS